MGGYENVFYEAVCEVVDLIQMAQSVGYRLS
jgi:hypothetical protein